MENRLLLRFGCPWFPVIDRSPEDAGRRNTRGDVPCLIQVAVRFHRDSAELCQFLVVRLSELNDVGVDKVALCLRNVNLVSIFDRRLHSQGGICGEGRRHSAKKAVVEDLSLCFPHCVS